MEITSKGRYAMHIMVDLANCGEGYLSLAEISEKHNISVKYLEKIISSLVKAKLVKSARGAAGGYKLYASADKITVKKILDATGDGAKIADCLEGGCPKKHECDTVAIWNTLKCLVDKFLNSITLQDLIEKTYKKKN